MKILGVKYLNFIVSFYDLIHFEIFEKRLTVAHQKSVARFDFYFESTTNFLYTNYWRNFSLEVLCCFQYSHYQYRYELKCLTIRNFPCFKNNNYVLDFTLFSILQPHPVPDLVLQRSVRESSRHPHLPPPPVLQRLKGQGLAQSRFKGQVKRS